MPSADLTDDRRLEELLRGAAPEGPREAALRGLIRELRTAAPAAPERVRERARNGMPSASPRRSRAPGRAALALALLLLVAGALGGAALVLRGVSTGGDDSGASGGEASLESGDELAPSEEAQRKSGSGEAGGGGGSGGSTTPVLRQILPRDERARDVDVSITLRLRDAERLSEAANEAMATAKALGGFVVASAVDTDGDEGSARLSLRVPVGRVEEAVLRLSEIGTITAQHVAIEDLQGGIDRRARRIDALRGEIRITELRLESGTLDREEALRLELRLERLRRLLARARAAHAGLVGEAAMAELSLLLHTDEPLSAREDRGRVASAAGRALDFLAVAGSATVFLLIAAGPLLLAALLVWLLWRARSRRLEAQLLAQPQPAARSDVPPA